MIRLRKRECSSKGGLIDKKSCRVVRAVLLLSLREKSNNALHKLVTLGFILAYSQNLLAQVQFSIQTVVTVP